MKIPFQSNVLANTKAVFSNITFFILSTFILFWVLTLDRSLIYDNANYLKYFSGNQLSHFFNQFDMFSVSNKFYYLFTEEYLWLLYADFVSLFFSPSNGVIFTVFLLNFLLIVSFYKLKRPLLALLFWIIFPMGLAVCGVAQIRQGLAFSVFTFLLIYFNRPLLSAVIASMIHTTFCIPLVFIFLYIIFKNKKFFLLSLICLIVIFAIIFINQFFLDIGGRRALTYVIDDGATSINFVISLTLFVIPTLYSLYFKKKWDIMLVTHFGLFIWLFLAFFLFPLGTSRVSYYSYLFLTLLIGDTYENTPFINLYAFYVFVPIVCFFVLQAFYGGVFNTLQLPF